MKSRTDNAKRLARAELARAAEMDARLDAMEAAGDVGDHYRPWLDTLPGRMWKWDPPHLEHIQATLDRVTTGEVKRLIIELPPRHGKSEMVTIRYPVYRMQRDPSTRVILGAYNQALANKFSRKIRRLAKERIEFSPDARGVEDWETVQGGGLRAVGAGGGVTGHGGDVIVIDDPVKSREEAESDTYRERVWEWFTDDIWTRKEPDAAVVVIMTRWHPDDLVGRLLDSEDTGEWEVVRLPANAEEDDPLDRGMVPCPSCSDTEEMVVTCGTCGGAGEVGAALWPERFDEEALADIARMLGPRSYAGLYQQSPRPREGDFFRWSWFDTVDEAPAGPDVKRVRAWDTAGSEGRGDYTAGVLMSRTAAGVYIIEDVVKGQWSPAKRDEIMRATAEKDAQKYGRTGFEVWLEQEAGVAGTERTQATIRLLSGYRVRAERVTGNKENRADPLAAQAEVGNVKLLRGKWHGEFLAELTDFPGGKHDDQVDAASMAFTKLARSVKGVARGFTHRLI